MSNSNETLYIIVGVAAGGGFAACVALCFLALQRRKQLRNSFENNNNNNNNNTSNNVGSIGVVLPEEGALTTTILGDNVVKKKNNQHHHQILLLSSEIVLHKNTNDDDQDVSTLGDPAMTAMQILGDGEVPPDEQTASIENDYDYHKQMLRAHGGMSSLDSDGRVSSDASLENIGQQLRHNNDDRLEIVAPKGKLGMVIDTPNGGVPMVHAIKNDSVLSSQVKVGDRLVLVDGDDVTCMTAMQVSKLIALKSDQERNLVFWRVNDIHNSGSASVGCGDVHSITT